MSVRRLSRKAGGSAADMSFERAEDAIINWEIVWRRKHENGSEPWIHAD